MTEVIIVVNIFLLSWEEPSAGFANIYIKPWKNIIASPESSAVHAVFYLVVVMFSFTNLRIKQKYMQKSNLFTKHINAFFYQFFGGVLLSRLKIFKCFFTTFSPYYKGVVKQLPGTVNLKHFSPEHVKPKI